MISLEDINKISDEDIVDKVRLKDRDFYAYIIDRYQNKLLRYVLNLVRDEDLAVDVVQETFIKAFVNLNGFDTKRKFSSWIYRIAHNEALNTIKKFKKEVLLSDEIEFESEENIESDFEKKETREIVEECLKEMSLLYSEPLSLYYFEERTYEEISDILQIPMGTVAVRISRARILMKKICQRKR